MTASRTGIAIAALPGVLMLAMFYSLAIHMHVSLGAWPTSIGENGFPSPLVTHAAIAMHVFAALFYSMLVLPFPILVCLLVKPWRRFAVYLASYAGFLVLCFLLMQAAPAQFLYWWWD